MGTKIIDNDKIKTLKVIEERQFLGGILRIWAKKKSSKKIYYMAAEVAELVEYSSNSDGSFKVSVFLNPLESSCVNECEKQELIIDAKPEKGINKLSNPSKEYKHQKMTFISHNGLIFLLNNVKARNIKAKKLLKIINPESKVITKLPLQCSFQKQLKTAISNFIRIFKGDKKKLKNLLIYESEFKILNYRVDIYFENLNLIVEYDETRHKYIKKEDLLREKEIKKELGSNVKIMRIEEGHECEKISNIIAYAINRM